MTADVEECFKKIIANRKPPKVEPMVDGYTGFLYFDEVLPMHFTGSITLNILFINTTVFIKCRCPK